MQATSQDKSDAQKILLAILNPIQVLLNFNLDIDELNVKMRIIAVFICKLLFICSPTFTNITQATAHALDDYLMANIHAYGVTNEPGTPTGFLQNGRRVTRSTELATNYDIGRGWLNSTYAVAGVYERPLYNGVSHYPIYGAPRDPLPVNGIIRQEDQVGALPNIWNVIMAIASSVRLIINEALPTYFSAYQDSYVTYLLRLNTFIFRNYEHRLRLPYNSIVPLLINHNTICGPPLNFTVSLKSVVHFFLNLPSSFSAEGMGIGGLTKVIRTCSQLVITTFFEGYQEIIRVPHHTPYSCALRALYVAFHQYPEWFGATNRVTYALRPYELPSKDRATRVARGVVLTNSVVGPSRPMVFQEWRVHLSRGGLLFILYQSRDSLPSITLDWYIPYQLHVSPIMPKLPVPFTVNPDAINSARSTITFGSFTEFHITNVDVEASVDTWLVNDMQHKFMIIHNDSMVRSVPSAGLNNMVRRVNTTSHGAVEIVSMPQWFEKMFLDSKSKSQSTPKSAEPKDDNAPERS
ncbi:unnamed protein product, partial [Brenthis ino]